MRIRNKDIVGDAVRWDGENTAEVVKFVRGTPDDPRDFNATQIAEASKRVEVATSWSERHVAGSDPVLCIEMLAHAVRVPLGWWAVRDKNAALSINVLTPSVFETTYEPMPEVANDDPEVLPGMSGAAAAQVLSRMVKAQFGVHVNPIALMLFIREYWDRIAPIAHRVHEAPDDTKSQKPTHTHGDRNEDAGHRH